MVEGLPVALAEHGEEAPGLFATYSVQLGQRESQVLAELVAGRQVRQIAAEGSVSEATVRTQVKSVLSKLGVGSQLAAVSMAHRAGWRGPGS